MSDFNLKSTTIEKALDGLKDFLERVIGPSVDEIGLAFADNLKIRRLKNQIRNFEKVKKIVEEQKISVQQINLKVLFPYLEGVALEEEETLQNIWANLFVNYVDTSKNFETAVFPQILRQLSTHEVEILMYGQTYDIVYPTIANLYGIMEPQTTGISYSMVELDNLERLGLIATSTRENKWQFTHPEIEKRLHTAKRNSVKLLHYDLTRFGVTFLEACTR